MSDTIEARVTRRFAASPGRVYDSWFDPAAVRAWMGAALREMGLPGDVREVRIDARVGGGFLFTDRRGDGEARHWGRYLELDRPRRLVFTWITDPSEEEAVSRVTISIEPAGPGCVVTLVHEMDKAWADYRERTVQGWDRMLRAIDARLDS